MPALAKSKDGAPAFLILSQVRMVGHSSEAEQACATGAVSTENEGQSRAVRCPGAGRIQTTKKFALAPELFRGLAVRCPSGIFHGVRAWRVPAFFAGADVPAVLPGRDPARTS